MLPSKPRLQVYRAGFHISLNLASLPLSAALVVLLAVILVPAGHFLLLRLLPLLLLEEVVCLRNVGFLLGEIGILVLLGHEILPLK